MLLAGHDALMVADTGSGKTLTYVLPAIVHLCAQARPARRNGPVALVMTPTRELTMQVADQFRTFEVLPPLRLFFGARSVDAVRFWPVWWIRCIPIFLLGCNHCLPIFFSNVSLMYPINMNNLTTIYPVH